MKQHIVSLVIKKIKIKTAVRYTLPLEWLKLKRLTIANVDENVEQLELAHIAD